MVKIPVVCLVLVLCGCGRSNQKPELITKMRPLGVSTTPAIAAPGDKVHLTFHFALPAAETIASDIYEAPDSKGYALPVSGLVLTDEQAVTDSACGDKARRCSFASFDYFAVTASFTVPPIDLLKLSEGSSRRLHYGIGASSASNSTAVVGDIFVFAPGSPQLDGAPAAADITEPASNVIGADATIPIRASITKYFDEPAKVGWFAGCGEVGNRRAIETTWKTPASGSCTLVFTVRGRDSRAMAIKIKDYDIK